MVPKGSLSSQLFFLSKRVLLGTFVTEIPTLSKKGVLNCAFLVILHFSDL